MEWPTIKDKKTQKKIIRNNEMELRITAGVLRRSHLTYIRFRAIGFSCRLLWKWKIQVACSSDELALHQCPGYYSNFFFYIYIPLLGIKLEVKFSRWNWTFSEKYIFKAPLKLKKKMHFFWRQVFHYDYLKIIVD